ncbi:MAG: Hsp20/alpha crystallin family protein [Gammaproteobacteria bacterium]|nr:Hsp20/alpha crystallin family protein [Gammaproteobacteria bacterium]MDE0225427.1 Hsp20/alpha crystallin family protein [Gammaproteobacteria bacterium]
MNLVHWDPIRDFENLFRPGAVLPAIRERGSNWMPAIDVRESGDVYRVDVELPAVAPEDVEVNCKDGLLTISGERKYERENDDERMHRSERLYGRFARSFRLPDDADQDSIEATAAHGVVTISVAKRENARARSIEVKIAN